MLQMLRCSWKPCFLSKIPLASAPSVQNSGRVADAKEDAPLSDKSNRNSELYVPEPSSS